ncbi:MAG: DUF1559 domain-containing protein [Pirellulaceae bacterium]
MKMRTSQFARHYSDRQRTGFTIVELLVVIAIIAVLVAITVPAVGMARNRMRMAQNQNNLRQISQAIQNYTANKQNLPPGVRFYNPAQKTLDFTSSWAFELLPYLDSQNLYDQLNVMLPAHRQTNGAFSTPVEVFSNPLFSRVAGYVQGPFTSGGSGTCIDYAANGGVVYSSNPRTDPLNLNVDAKSGPVFEVNGKLAGPFTWSNGAGFRERRYTTNDLRDGQSTTIAVGDRWTPDTVLSPSAQSTTKLKFDGAAFVGQNITSHTRYANFVSESSPQAVLPLSKNDANETAAYKFGVGSGSIIYFAYMDGSARPLNVDIEPIVFKALLTMNGGETIPAGVADP